MFRLAQHDGISAIRLTSLRVYRFNDKNEIPPNPRATICRQTDRLG
jgi:hypothetical protein